MQAEGLSKGQPHPACPRTHREGWGPGGLASCTEFCPFTESSCPTPPPPPAPGMVGEEPWGHREVSHAGGGVGWGGVCSLQHSCAQSSLCLCSVFPPWGQLGGPR